MSEIECKPRCPRANFRHNGGHTGRPSLQRLRGCRQRQHGTVSLVFALMLVVLLGLIGLSLNLAMLYNRRVELQGVADSTALAAARELIGTNAGVSHALSRARTSAESFKFRYSNDNVTWSDAAIMFSATGAANSWVDAAAALAAPGSLLFAKVDTSALAPNLNTVNTGLMGLLPGTSVTTTTYGSAIAGRSSVRVTPLGVCALSATPANQRINPGASGSANVSELEEYGFRRGVGYDLMNLSDSFVINPIDAIGTPGFESDEYPEVVSPLVCAGVMPLPSVIKTSTGATTTISVGHPFPIAALFKQLNSRFDQYDATLPRMACIPQEAPPDVNIKAYDFKTPIPWMKDAPSQQVAISASSWGVLWSYAAAVSYAPSEPTGGYAALGTATWPTLYPVTGYLGGEPTALPYMTNVLAPSRPGLPDRRVLNVPLLSCPVAANANTSAKVLAIGRFFMTVPATAASINVEFAGLVREESLGGHVELYP